MEDMVTIHQSETIAEHIQASGISRRKFIEFCGLLMAAAPAGLSLSGKASAQEVAKSIGKARRPSVIWLHFQECTGCSESILHTSRPDVADLIFNVISLDYHETLMAASGYQAEAAMHEAMEANSGKYVLVVEGAIPTKENGAYMKLAGKPALDVLNEVASKAALVIAMGSCASWGGVAAADPNPTGAQGVDSLLKGTTVVNLPGCPPNPYTFLSVVLEYAALHHMPLLDESGRPKSGYDRLIHEHCPRRAHFDAGRFASVFGDAGHRQGWCLYKLGCKGPVTHAPCSTLHFNEIPDAWPIGIGAPCFGCTERATGFHTPAFQTAEIHAITPPEELPSVTSTTGKIGIAAAATAGVVIGSVATAAIIATNRLPDGGAEAGDKPKDKGLFLGGK
jgi:hydrogenase small subunit